jgi:hypothetical protein
VVDVSQEPGWWQDGGGDWRTPTYATEKSRLNRTAIIAFVASFFFWPAGIVLGHVARRQIHQRGDVGGGWALAALIISYLSAAFGVLLIALTLSGSAGPKGPGFKNEQTLESSILTEMEANLKNPSNAAYSPGTSVTATICNPGSGTYYKCVIALSNGRSQTLSVTVSTDGSHWTVDH